ncbi:MAG: ferredoxin [Candidatus Acetothermia bacterium]
MSAKVEIDEDACIACGICYQSYPDVYESDDNGKSRLVAEHRTEDERTGEVSDDLVDSARGGEEDCPVDAIEVSQD